MTQLAIRGNETRGEEVIEILEMLGGKNLYNYYADCDSLCFYMQRDKIIYRDDVNNCEDLLIFTLEEFLEKFPYKVGDKVTLGKFPCEIKGMSWEYDDIIYYVEGTDFSKGVYSKDKDLQPYKEETMEESTNKAIFDGNAQCCDIMNDIIKKDMEEIKIDIPKGYEFAGVDDDKQQVVFTKIGHHYPRTYEECCDVLKIPNNERYIYIDVPLSYNKVLKTFTQLLICRDAYWKIAGEQMGLDKPWKPYWTIYKHKFCLGTDKDKVIEECVTTGNRILAFPTTEMRDVFYENFKELINQCKELL